MGVNPAHDGHFLSEELVPPLEPRWSVEGSGGFALAADGRVFVAGEEVYALDQGDGRRLWTVPKEPNDLITGAAYEGGLVIVTAYDDIRAYRADSGALAWTKRLGDERGIYGPVASGGVVYTTVSNYVVALRASDGAELWVREKTVGGADTPALDDHRLYLAGTCDQAQALDRASGAVAWSHPEGDCVNSDAVTPALFGGRLWGVRSILDAADGTTRGTHPLSRPVFVDGVAFEHSPEQRAIASDASTGKELWRTKTPVGDSIAIGHDIYSLRFEQSKGDQRLSAFDAETGARIWNVRPPHKGLYGARGTLAAAPGMLIAVFGGRVTAYRSVFRPKPRGIDIGASSFDVIAGRGYDIGGVLGTELRGSRPRVSLEDAGWRHGRFHRFGRLKPARDGGFVASITTIRNSRVRVSAARVHSKPITVYAYPKVRLGRSRGLDRARAVVGVSVEAPRTRLAGHRVVLYLQQSRKRPLVRLGSGRLSGPPGRGHASVRFRPRRHVGRRALIWHCVTGQLRLALGRPSMLTRRCGARVLRRP